MSAISLKSITGITSITTPTGVDNQLTLHNNNTTEAVKLDVAGNLHFHNHLNITGVSTASNFKTGTSNLHNTGLNVQDLDVDGHTNLDNVSVAGVSTFSGGAGAVTIAANGDIRFGNSGSWSGEHAGKIQYFSNRLYLQGGSNGHQLRNHSGGTVFEIGSTGSCAGMDLTLAQDVTFNGDIDVDGHTNLDNVSVAGVSTFTGQIYQTAAGSNTPKITLNNASDTTGMDVGYSESSGTGFINVGQSGSGLSIKTGGTAAGNERLNITSAGKIEVKGTRAGALQASDDDTLQLYTASTNESINRGSGITFYNHDGSGSEMGGTIQVAKENGTADNVASYMRFSTRPAGGSATERLRIDSNGDVGINATNPTEKLHVGGNIKLTGQFYQSMPADYWSQSNTFIELNGMGNLTHMGSYETCLTSNGYRNSSTQWTSYAINSYTGASQIRLNPQGYISFGTESNKANGSTHTVTEKLRITSGGKLLLGTTDTGFSDTYTTMTVGNSSLGNSGITIASSATGIGRLHFADANSGAAIYAGWIAYNHNSNSLLFSTNQSGTEKVTINSSGQVLIGTNSSPDCKLTVTNGTLMIETHTTFYSGSGENGENYPTIFFKGDHSSGNNPAHGKISVRHSAQNTYSGDLVFMPQGYYSGSYGYQEVMRVSAYKRVGINVTPTSTLHVVNNSSDSTIAQFGKTSDARYARFVNIPSQENFDHLLLSKYDNSLSYQLRLQNTDASGTGQGSAIQFIGHGGSQTGLISVVNRIVNSSTARMHFNVSGNSIMHLEHAPRRVMIGEPPSAGGFLPNCSYTPLQCRPSSTNTGCFAGSSKSYTTNFGLLPWSGGGTYLSSGITYNNGSWLHQSSDNTNCLFYMRPLGWYWYSSDNGSGSWNVSSGGQVMNNLGQWTGGTSSDRRLKDNITNMISSDALTKVTQLQGVSYTWKDEVQKKYGTGPYPEGTHHGFIAQDVKTVWPDAHIISDSDNESDFDDDPTKDVKDDVYYGDIEGVKLEKMVPLLVEAIKELKKENDALKARVTTLEGS